MITAFSVFQRLSAVLLLSTTSAAVLAQSPSAPRDLTATFTDSGVQISWSASGDDDTATGYNLYRDGQYYTTVFTTHHTLPESLSLGHEFYVVSFDDPNVDEARAYSVRSALIAVPHASPTPAITANTANRVNQAPSAPTALSAQRISETAAELMWSGASDDVAVKGYNVYRNDIYIATVFTNTYQDVSLQAGASYSYTVVAFDQPHKFSTKSPAVTVSGSVGSTAIVGMTGPNPEPEKEPEPATDDTAAPEKVNGLVTTDSYGNTVNSGQHADDSKYIAN